MTRLAAGQREPDRLSDRLLRRLGRCRRCYATADRRGIFAGPAAYEELLPAEEGDARYRIALAFEELCIDPRIQRAAYYDDLRKGRNVLLVPAHGAEIKERALGLVKRADNHLSYRGRWLHEQNP